MTGVMAGLPDGVFSSLQLLLKASSKDAVQKLCRDSFPRSAVGSVQMVGSVSSSLSVTAEEASQVIQAVHSLTRHLVYRGLTSAEQISSVFPDDFHQNLKNLLTKIILENISSFMDDITSDLIIVSLIATSGRYGLEGGHQDLVRLRQNGWRYPPIQEDPGLCGLEPATSSLTMELSKETLDTMLDGLGRIRDQLSAVANK
ncbi:unnamed protein product [Ranitomeya imitator]|uniref:COMMD9 N-terminal domain-containing protein n=1 Tax=Ranitomeya imitator TaxID=111125 RepID=A0ABN9L360_9NEOB|nr:unnamed protein product [Ranitomeya imitator]